MARTKSFTLSEDLEAPSEVVREPLTRLAEEQRKEAAALSALDHGAASGGARPGTFARVRQRHGLGCFR